MPPASLPQRPRRRRRHLQAASSVGGPVRSCFRTQVHVVVLASEPARWMATKRTSLRSLKLIGCAQRRLLPPLHTLQWECGSSRTPAVALLPMPKARRRYRNLTVWLPPHVTSAAAVPGRRLRRPSVVVAVVAASAAAATAAFAATAAHRRHRPPLHRRPPATAAAVACPWTPLHPAPARTARPVATTLLPLLLRCPCIVFCRCVLSLN